MNALEFHGVLQQLNLTALLPTLESRAQEAEVRQPPYREFLFELLNEAVRLKEPVFSQKVCQKGSGAQIQVGPDARWFEVEGHDLVDLGRRGPVRRILLALLAAHDQGTEQTLDVDAVVQAGWPNEHVRPDAGATRVYTAIRTLRRMGLEGILLTRDSGYLIDPRTTILRAS